MSTRALDRSDRRLATASLMLGAGLVANSLLGPLFLGVVTYPFTETVFNETLGLEAVSLVLIAPLAIVAGILAQRGDHAGRVLALGPAAYASYMLVQYVVGPQYPTYQPSIALHLGLFVLAGGTFIRAWSTIDGESLPAVSRGWAVAMALLTGFVVSRWLSAFAGMVSGQPVPAAGPDLTMYWSIFLIDMGVIVPAGLATTIGLVIDARWAAKALHALIGWFALVPPSVAAMSIVKVARADPYASTADSIVFVVVTIAFWAVAWRLYRRLFKQSNNAVARAPSPGPHDIAQRPMSPPRGSTT